MVSTSCTLKDDTLCCVNICYTQAGTEEFIERRMADGYELDVQGLQDEAPRDANASLVALARELVEVRATCSAKII